MTAACKMYTPNLSDKVIMPDSLHIADSQNLLVVQVGEDAGGLTAGLSQPAHETNFSDTKAIAQTTAKQPWIPSTVSGGNGKDDPLTCSSLAAPMHHHAIVSNAASQTHHGAAPPSSSRLTAAYSSVEHVSIQQAGLCPDNMQTLTVLDENGCHVTAERQCTSHVTLLWHRLAILAGKLQRYPI